MNIAHEPTPHDVFLNVRKAYRLLHDYQRMVLDGIRYIESQLDISYNGGWIKYSNRDVKSGYAKLYQSSWDWLPMMWYEFHFLKPHENDTWLSLSFLILSDTGWLQTDESVTDRENPSDFAQAEKSASKFAFILRKTNWDPLQFMGDKVQMRDFIKEGGSLPEDFIEKGFVGKCYNMSCLTSVEELDKVIDEVIGIAKKNSWTLECKKKLSEAIQSGTSPMEETKQY
jgi:hypothetical protein